LHYPLLPQLKKEGYPIEGVTISAGVPTREKAGEILKTFTEAGLWCNSFKPGSDSQIASVLEIAQDHPHLTLIMQIEGGKAGGHHSWESLYGLLERNYAKIRRQKNIILCTGGGIGLEEQAAGLLMGTWHENNKVMPVDAVFLGTRLMACQEAKTSPQVKKLLVTIEGTPRWVQRGEFADGVTSGQSQLGADVHYADNTMSRVANLVDQFSDRGEEAILNHKQEIIEAINKTCKPYFGELSQMTYAAVLERMIDLMAPGKIPSYIPHDGEWFDITFRTRVFDLARRAVGRLLPPSLILPPNGEGIMSSPFHLDHPKNFLKKFVQEIPASLTTTLHPEDVDYFLFLCRRPGKPVNFVPVIDKNLKRWFKSDTLWQSHDPRYLADTVFTIPGTEAVKGIQKVNEPVATILENFANEVIQKLKGKKKVAAKTAPQALLSSCWVLEGKTRRPNLWPRFIKEGRARISKSSANKVQIILSHTAADGRTFPLTLTYTYHPEEGLSPLHLVEGAAKEEIRKLYQKLWIGVDQKGAKKENPWQTFQSEEVVRWESMEQYAAATRDRHFGPDQNPHSFAIALLWRPLASCLLH
ncbi:MAG: DUF1729 domain-containing protein, partial [bacterium]|nr:DUF1729 domain-containing protein [bacterium]